MKISDEQHRARMQRRGAKQARLRPGWGVRHAPDLSLLNRPAVPLYGKHVVLVGKRVVNGREKELLYHATKGYRVRLP